MNPIIGCKSNWTLIDAFEMMLELFYHNFNIDITIVECKNFYKTISKYFVEMLKAKGY